MLICESYLLLLRIISFAGSILTLGQGIDKASDSVAEESPSSINVSLNIRKSLLRPLHVSIRIITIRALLAIV